MRSPRLRLVFRRVAIEMADSIDEKADPIR